MREIKKLDNLEAEKSLRCGKSHNFGNIALIIRLKQDEVKVRGM